MITYKTEIGKYSFLFINLCLDSESHIPLRSLIILVPVEHNIAGKSASTNVEVNQRLKHRKSLI